MADPLRYIEGLNETTDPASADWLWIVDASAEAADKDRKVSAGLVPWTNSPSTFTSTVAVAPATPVAGAMLGLDMPVGALATQRALRWRLGTEIRGYIQTDIANNLMAFSSFDNGAGAGPNIALGSNNNASTPAASYLQLAANTGTGRRIWPDATGMLRIGTSIPTNANDTSGTIVGTQTSSLDAKDVTGAPLSVDAVLEHIAEAAAAVRRFTYKSGAYNGEEFSGLVVDYAPRYGMDRDAEHPHGKSLNVITAIGDLMIAVDYLAGRVAALEAYNAR